MPMPGPTLAPAGSRPTAAAPLGVPLPLAVAAAVSLALQADAKRASPAPKAAARTLNAPRHPQPPRTPWLWWDVATFAYIAAVHLLCLLAPSTANWNMAALFAATYFATACLGCASLRAAPRRRSPRARVPSLAARALAARARACVRAAPPRRRNLSLSRHPAA